MRTVVVLAACLALAASLPGRAKAAPAVPDVIVDHDGAVDDLVALSLLAKSGRVRVRAVTVCPADAYLEPATRATLLFLDRMGVKGATVAQGHDEGANPFPAEWRRDAAQVLEIDALKGREPTGANPLAREDAAHTLVRLLSGRRSYTILETGPLTNIAGALRLKPLIARRIRRIYVMGGAVRVPGNVSQAGHDGSAEWNVFNQPQAAAEVIASGVPVTLVALDATNKVPLRSAFVDRLAQRPAVAAQLAAKSLRLTLNQLPDGYYFWDTLTAAALLDPGVVTVKRMRLKVLTAGPSQGRTVEAADGAPVDVAIDADRARVERLFLDVLGRP
jgi:purine nucleosidase